MREILFRGKSTGDLAPWIYGYYLYDKDYDKHCICDKITLRRYEVIPETVGRYTGLKDKKGKEIWEGDIVSRFMDTQRALVEFIDGCFMSIILLSGGAAPQYDILCNDLSVTEIIGNIHQHPELLQNK